MGTRVEPGRFYVRHPVTGQFEEVRAGTPAEAWICRRLSDYAPGTLPAGAWRGTCTVCGAVVGYNPRSVELVPPGTPKVCMQCAGIEPLPL